MKHFGRKLICLALAAMMILSSTGALADAPTVTYNLPQDVSVDRPSPIFSIQHNGENFDWQIYRMENGITEPATTELGSGIAVGGENESGSINVNWDYWFNGDYTPYNGGVSHRLVVSVNDVVTTSVDFYVNYFANHLFDRVSFESWYELENGELIEMLPSNIIPEKKVYFSHNTVCSFGPQFRCISPEMTDKWYMFTPLNLSQDGKQVYEMISGNTYLIGYVTVTVNGDNIRVEYEYFNDDIWVYDEFFTFFHDYDSVTTEDVEELKNELTYGKTYSIANDLGGDTDVLLFTCNEVTFTKDNPDIVRIFRSDRERKALREQMLEMIGKVEVAFD